MSKIDRSYELLNDILGMQRENECLEFKEASKGFDFSKLGKYFSALSNEANLNNKKCSYLVFGISDNQEIVGTAFRENPSDLHSLKNEIANKTNDRITFSEIYEVITQKGRVIIFEIPPAPFGIPTSWEGHYYAREGESIVPLNINKLEIIRMQANGLDWSAGICENATIDDLDEKAIAKARQEYKIKYSSNRELLEEVDTWDDITFLNKAKVTKEGKITNAAILLLGKEESTRFIEGTFPTITWILKDKDNIEQDYEHFTIPYLINVDNITNKIRNLKYRYIPVNQVTVFPIELTMYDNFVLREALNNGIAHQSYLSRCKMNVVEFPDKVIFDNAGSFIPQNILNVLNSNNPPKYYRNPFLLKAMCELNMIDTIGSGIKRMFTYQRNRNFPLPDYELENDSVTVTIYGKIINGNYSATLIEDLDLSLVDVYYLDRIQKGHKIPKENADFLRKKKLIEGKYPNIYIASKVAEVTREKDKYVKNKAFDDKYYKDLIVKFIEQYGRATKKEIEELLSEKLSNILTNEQKKVKVKNLLQSLAKDEKIESKGKIRGAFWIIRK